MDTASSSALDAASTSSGRAWHGNGAAGAQRRHSPRAHTARGCASARVAPPRHRAGTARPRSRHHAAAGKRDARGEAQRDRAGARFADRTEKKLELAPELLGSNDQARPRATLDAALHRRREDFTGAERAPYERLATSADDTLLAAIFDSFRFAFLISGALALLAGALIWPLRARSPTTLAGSLVLALVIPLAYAIQRDRVAPPPVTITDPCSEHHSPSASGLQGAIQSSVLKVLDRDACRLHTSTEELILASGDDAERRRFAREQISDGTPSTGELKQSGKQTVGIVQENPLGLAIGAAAIGFLASMMIPSTKVEDEHIGQLADQVRSKQSKPARRRSSTASRSLRRLPRRQRRRRRRLWSRSRTRRRRARRATVKTYLRA